MASAPDMLAHVVIEKRQSSIWAGENSRISDVNLIFFSSSFELSTEKAAALEFTPVLIAMEFYCFHNYFLRCWTQLW